MKLQKLLVLFLFSLSIGCHNNKNGDGFYYNSTELKLKKATLFSRSDSIFIVDNLSTNNLSNENVYLKGKIHNENELQGEFNNGQIFRGLFYEKADGIKILSSDSTFVFQTFIDTASLLSEFKRYQLRRVKDFESFSVDKRQEFLSKLFEGYNTKITISPRLDKGYAEIPIDTKFYFITDFSALPFPIVDENAIYPNDVAKKINQKTPLLIRVSNRSLVVRGNRFNDGGLSRSMVGATYHYGDYSYEKNRREVQFYFYDIQNDSIVESNFGYVSYDNAPPTAFSFFTQEESSTEPWINLINFLESYQTIQREKSWTPFIESFKKALVEKDKAKLSSLVAPTVDGISSRDWISRLLSNNEEVLNFQNALAAEDFDSNGKKMKCFEALCLHFEYIGNRWLFIYSFYD